MRRRNFIALIGSLLSIIGLNSCVHEFAVMDYSFEFSAQVTYDDSSDEHRLTLTRKSGMEDGEYNIAFRLDEGSPISLKDKDGRIHEESMKENFSNVSARTYTISRMTAGEHILHLDISTSEFSQQIDIVVTVEDFSFNFDAQVLFDEDTKMHTLEVTLEDGSAEDTYTVHIPSITWSPGIPIRRNSPRASPEDMTCRKWIRESIWLT